ncbi:MAG TPA: hypothetical protein VIF09_11165 [Polyangiaceae bacterium]
MRGAAAALLATAVAACRGPASSAPPAPPPCRDGLTVPLPEGHVTSLAVGGAAVYWVDEDARDPVTRVWGMSVRDGAPALLATEPGRSGGLVADEATGYVAIQHRPRVELTHEVGDAGGRWGQRVVNDPAQDGYILGVSLDRPKRPVLGGLRCVEGLALDRRSIFWVDVTGVFEMDRKGGAPHLAARMRGMPGDACNRLANRSLVVDDHDIFLGQVEHLSVIPRPGGGEDLLGMTLSHRWASMDLPQLASLTGADATTLTFVGPPRPEGDLAVRDAWRIPKSGGAVTSLGPRPADTLEASDAACVYTVTGSPIGAQELHVTRRR